MYLFVLLMALCCDISTRQGSQASGKYFLRKVFASSGARNAICTNILHLAEEKGVLEQTLPLLVDLLKDLAIYIELNWDHHFATLAILLKTYAGFVVDPDRLEINTVVMYKNTFFPERLLTELPYDSRRTLVKYLPAVIL